MPFVGDLALGNKYEQEFITLTKPSQYKIIKGKFKEYDIEVEEEGKTVYYEVKSDRWTHKTNNLCIEFMCNNVDSGITTTKADYYIYFEIMPTGYKMYKIPVSVLKEAIGAKKYHKTMNGGDGYRSKFYLFHKMHFESYLPVV